FLLVIQRNAFYFLCTGSRSTACRHGSLTGGKLAVLRPFVRCIGFTAQIITRLGLTFCYSRISNNRHPRTLWPCTAPVLVFLDILPSRAAVLRVDAAHFNFCSVVIRGTAVLGKGDFTVGASALIHLCPAGARKYS